MTEIILLVAACFLVRLKINNDKRIREMRISNLANTFDFNGSQAELSELKKFYKENPNWHKLSLTDRKKIIENRIKDKNNGNTSSIN